MARIDNTKGVKRIEKAIDKLTSSVKNNDNVTKKNVSTQKDFEKTLHTLVKANEKLIKQNKQLRKSIKNVKGATEENNEEQGFFEQRINSLNSKYGKSIKQLAIWRNRLLIGAFAVGIIKRSVGSLIQQYDVLIKSQKQINAVLNSTGHSAGILKEEINELVTSQSRLTGTHESLLNSAAAVLLTFTNIGSEAFPRALSASEDLVAIFGGDLRSAVIRLGKALNDPITGVGALKETGTSFTLQQREQIKVLQESGDILGAQAIILNQVEKETGKLGQKMRETPMGEFKLATLELQRAAENLGAGLSLVVVGLTKTSTVVMPLIRSFNFLSEAMGNFMFGNKELNVLMDDTIDMYKKLSNETDYLNSIKGNLTETGNQELDQVYKMQTALALLKDKTFNLAQVNTFVGKTYEDEEAFILGLQKAIAELMARTTKRISQREIEISQEEAKQELIDKTVKSIEDEAKVLQAQLDLEGEALAIELSRIKHGDLYNEQIEEQVQIIYKLTQALNARNNAEKESEERQRKFDVGLEAGGTEGIVHHLENLDVLKQHWQDFALDSADVMTEMFDSYYAMQDVYIERAIGDINKEYAEKIKAVQGNVRLTEKLEKERDAKIKKLRNDQLDRDAGMVLAKGALSIAKIFARHGGPTPAAWGEVAIQTIQTGLQHQAVLAQKAAKGANFVTDGPQMLMVGDNAGGREHVQVTPLGDAPINPNLQSGNITLNITGNVLHETFVEDDIIPAIKTALQRGGDLNHSHKVITGTGVGKTLQPDWMDD